MCSNLVVVMMMVVMLMVMMVIEMVMVMAMVMMVVMIIEMVMVMNNSLCHPDSCFIIQHANNLPPDLKEKSEI